MIHKPYSRFQSLQWKLPLVSGALLLIVLAGFATAIYLEIRRATLATAQTRLQTIVQRLTLDSRSFFSPWIPRARAIGDLPEVRRRLRAGAGPVPSSLRQALGSSRLPDGGPLHAIDLRDLQGRVVARTEGVGGLPDQDVTAAMARGDSLGAGVFRAVDGKVVIPLFFRIMDGDTPLGYVLFWRGQPTIPEPARVALTDFIGPEAAYLLGDTTQIFWTDFHTTVVGPSVRLPVGEGGAVPQVVRYHRGEARFGAVGRVRGLPWLALVELPARVVLAPSDAFLSRLTMIAAGFVLLALVAAWLLSRRLTAPLGELAAAADTFNRGNRGTRVNITRNDEIGTVVNALNRMLDGTEQALARREKLAVLGQLAGGVGHELRNPLGVMNNVLYLLDARLRDRSPEVMEYLEILRTQVGLSDKIVGDLLDFARVRPPQREPVPLGDLVRRTVDRAPLEGVQVEVNLPSTLPPVIADEIQAGQVILNLLTNAAQAMDGRGGTLRVTGTMNGGGKVVLTVSDTGPGIPSENMERIFEPLFTTKARGMGLGLAVSRALAIANGGDLRVQSQEGAGATFEFALPTEQGNGQH